MRFGVGIPTCREGLAYPSGFANLQETARIAQTAEELGFDSLWANDHLATQHVVMDSLPAPPNFYEPLITYAYLAGQTSRIQFVAATVVAPLREPVVLAKQVATLDQASNGRFVLGLGIGAYREEFEAIATPSGRVNRGQVMEETVAALRLLFEQRRASFDGRHLRFREIEVYPKPVQRPFPIYLSGNSPPAIKRAACAADGWIVSGMSPERVSNSIALLREEAARAGRDSAHVEICLQLWVSMGESEEAARTALRRSQHFSRLIALRPGVTATEHEQTFATNNLLGAPAQIVERLKEYRDAGVDHIALVFLAGSVDEFLRQVQIFSESVLPAVRAA